MQQIRLPFVSIALFTYPPDMPNPNREFSLMPVRRQVRPGSRHWTPAADVYRSNDGWIVKVDLAGVCADELTIQLEDSNLRILGCRRDTLYRDGLICHQMEITYSRFEKRIQFPCAVHDASLDHDYHDGLLIITVKCK